MKSDGMPWRQAQANGENNIVEIELFSYSLRSTRNAHLEASMMSQVRCHEKSLHAIAQEYCAP